MTEPTTERPVLRVSVYSDYTCPWCYIGSGRLDRLREELGDRAELRVEWKPFEIHPEVPEEGMPVSALPYPREQWERMVEHLRREAAREGLEITSLGKVANTHRALVASAYVQAEEPERFPEFHDALFRAYFGEGRDLGDPAVVGEVARESGVDAERMEKALREGRYEGALAETTATAHRLGITGTPTFVFDERYAAVGAQPVEELRRVAERVLEEAG
ncbi:MAG TPA: DsbA family oxidoreductase [Longimicrobiaceae bacterium]|nr:DsbA family oxidoreductase [Longimicrobiaceae bacterium]